MNRSFQSLVFLTFLWIGFSCSEDKGMMLRQLEALEQANRDDSLMTNDSLAETLVTYFDKHGSANERMRARYMLGRTYYDLGEFPHALETFLEAADCADTLSSDCDYAKLSRVRAQMALIYESQVLPWSQLKELRMAEYYANRAGDTIQAIECYSQQAGAYEYLKMPDSIIIVMDNASEMFAKVHRYDRSAQVLAMAIIPLIDKGKLEVARKYINIYEKNSGFFDEQGNILKGRQIYYYIKGYYYLAVSKIDSAEMMFRKELREASTLNHLIAGSKGLQEVYSRKGIVDSVAKYANLGYELNDSAYSLSEMQNIQKLQASYNYNYNKLLAEQKTYEVERANNLLISATSLIVLMIIAAILWILYYRRENKRKQQAYHSDLRELEKIQTELMDILSEEKLTPKSIFEKKQQDIQEILNRIKGYQLGNKDPKMDLEERLNTSGIVAHLKQMVNANPYQHAGMEDFKELRTLINEEIPHFYTSVNTVKYTLSPIEYDVTLLIRVHFSPSDICKLTGISKSYVSNIRSRLLLKVFCIDGPPKDYDQRILNIR